MISHSAPAIKKNNNKQTPPPKPEALAKLALVREQPILNLKNIVCTFGNDKEKL